MCDNKEPLPVRVIKDGNLSSFERKTITLGWVGLIVAFLSLTAAAAAAYFIHQQFSEMTTQTGILQSQLTQQQNAFKVTERAWISLYATQFEYVKDAQRIPRADAILKIINTGPSPAFGIHMWRCAEVRASEPAIGSEPEARPPCIVEDIGIMGTNISVSFEMPDRTQPIEPNSLAVTPYERGRHLYVWGKVTYKVLAEDKQHFTSFCLLNAGNQLAPCEKGNEAN